MLAKAFVAALSLVASVNAIPSSHLKFHQRRAIDNATDYEYVIIGSGPGGGPLASRLAIAGHKVLLIEAGGDYGDNYNQSVPTYSLKSAEDDSIKWDYWVRHYEDLERQQKDTKMTYRNPDGSLYVGLYPPEGAEPLGILYPRTGALGGCSEHHALITTYPWRADWTYIQQLTGDDSWGPDEMRQHFVKLEKAQYPVGAGHGTDGWLRTSLTNLLLVAQDFKVLSIVLSAAAAMGKDGLLSSLLSTVTSLTNVLLTDVNANTDPEENIYQVPLSIDADTSKRSGTRAFILDTANAKNDDGSRKYHLDIALHTLATKIRFDESGDVPKAIGVEYLSGERLYKADPYPSASDGTAGYVAASKDVIISGGSFNTPQLLKLSGIGPKDELDQFGIKVIKDAPGVGSNMQDRYEAAIVAETAEKFPISADCTFGYDGQADPCLEKWINGKSVLDRGPYTTSGAAVGVVLKTSVAQDHPDIFIIGTPGVFNGFYPGFAYDSVKSGKKWSWLALKAQPQNNAGTVKLRSTDPRDVPEILFRSLDTGNTTGGGDERDLQALYEGLLWGREAFDKLIPLDGTFTEANPGRNVSSEADLKEYIKNELWGHHACCTAAIGPDGDPNAVLDSNFKVRGVEGLRVVDASIFPKIPGTFISLPIYMISEKAAEAIINGD
ncbi:Oxygen-dependent choline dehydrogenase [Cercospora beticola]|uniref:Oxygen-dependent choline dehydrogenase n=1 Tax=Cercospora beticola TaxID=122368 RepID=A0A2G5HHQ0_CERBT|nr:Oxygen-dependent choline dehydrogenase [Cercospora beticola]PIA92070.1 Oxygen-dependent choline dehydrogenase [Cercospora beticola]WPB06118.1 hypothetical protein RHO25_010775 [Cercospora beticola]CAK1366001.1 unnamed protein product [Cercospora beticola]